MSHTSPYIMAGVVHGNAGDAVIVDSIWGARGNGSRLEREGKGLVLREGLVVARGKESQ